MDCVFAVNEALAEAERPFNPETHVAPHGVDREHFKKALSEDTAVPSDLARLPAPVLGFYGTIADWVDVGLLAQVAQLRPDWTLVLIGTASSAPRHSGSCRMCTCSDAGPTRPCPLTARASTWR